MRVAIGKVGRPHGIDGAFFVEQPSDDTRWWKTGARFLAGGAPVEVVAHRTSSGRPVIKVEPPVERGALLEVERADLPATDEDEYYAFELVGLQVVEETGRALGTVRGRDSRCRERRARARLGRAAADGRGLHPRRSISPRGRIEVAAGFAG